jgi:hypothetical protein
VAELVTAGGGGVFAISREDPRESAKNKRNFQGSGPTLPLCVTIVTYDSPMMPLIPDYAAIPTAPSECLIIIKNSIDPG